MSALLPADGLDIPEFLRRDKKGVGIDAIVHDTGEVVAVGPRGIDLPGRTSAVALDLPDGLTFDEWRGIGETLKGVEKSLMWWIGDWLCFGERRYGETYSQAIDATEKSYSALSTAKSVAARFEVCRRRQNLSFAHHAEVAALPPEAADRLLKLAEDEGWSHKDLRAKVGHAKRLAKAISDPKPLEDSYSVVVIDPPWPMQKIEREVRPNQVGFDYPTMEEDEIAALFQNELRPGMDANCHVFIWTTHRFLPMTLRLLEPLSADYVLTMVWHKPGGFQPVGLPQYNCEFVVYARAGTPKFADTKAFNCCFDAPRREHSRKPDEFYDLVRRVTSGSRIDVFSREKREGFDQYGNQVDAFAEGV